MDVLRLRDRIARGIGTAARVLGSQCDAFRPVSAHAPLDPANRFVRLPAAFTAGNGLFRRPVGYGDATWVGLFDSAYTQPGDYIAGPAGVFFIAAQQSLLPSLCILTTHTVDVVRAANPTSAGVTSYGGITKLNAEPVLTCWPASVLFVKIGPAGDLPGEVGTPIWNVLLPITPLPILNSDILRDNQGQNYVVTSAESTSLGWRLLVRTAAL